MYNEYYDEYDNDYIDAYEATRDIYVSEMNAANRYVKHSGEEIEKYGMLADENRDKHPILARAYDKKKEQLTDTRDRNVARLKDAAYSIDQRYPKGYKYTFKPYSQEDFKHDKHRNLKRLGVRGEGNIFDEY